MKDMDRFTYSDQEGKAEYGKLTAGLSHKISELVLRMEGQKKYSGQFMASVYALRVLQESWPTGGGFIPTSKVEFWEKSYLHWVNRIKRFPDGITREQLIESAKAEFSSLLKMSTKIPQGTWLSGLLNAFRLGGRADVGREIYDLVLLRQDWGPCQLMDNGKKGYTLTFDRFDMGEPAFDSMLINNDGKGWTEALTAYSEDDLLENVNFASTAAKFKATSANIAFLDQLRNWLIQLIKNNPHAIDRVLQRKSRRVTTKPVSNSSIESDEADQANWRPCRLVPFASPAREQKYSLTFDQFQLADSIFAERALPNDGYCWTELLIAYADKRTLKILNFDPESSLISVSAPNLESLQKVRGWIKKLLDDPKALDKAIKRK